MTYKKKNFVKHIENLPQHLSEKFIGDSLSITDIALRNWDLSIIGIVQSIFEIINYCCHVSTERLSCSLLCVHAFVCVVHSNNKLFFTLFCLVSSKKDNKANINLLFIFRQ